MKLHLGCGQNYKKGYINCDFSDNIKLDKKFDITKKIPFDDNSVEEILISHVLEHIQKPIEVLKEMYRICKNNAIIKIRVPYFSSESAFGMLDHYSFYSYTTFDCLEKTHPCHWQGIGNFEIIDKKLKWDKRLILFEKIFTLTPKITRIYQELFCWWFPAKELIINLKAVK